MRSLVSSSAATSKHLMLLGGTCCNLNTRRNISHLVSPIVVQRKVHARVGPLKTNGRASPTEHRENEEEIAMPLEAALLKQSPIWKITAVIILRILLSTAETFFTWNPSKIVDPFQGNLAHEGMVFRQNFSIRSYHIDFNCKASIGAIIKILQDTSLNHARVLGLLADGFGSSPAMSKRNLIWVTIRMEIVVGRYPTWGDVVQVEKWISASGKNSMRSDWLFRDNKTGESLVRASSFVVMMNTKTRRLSKFIEEVRNEFKPHFRDCDPIIDQDCTKLLMLDVNTADYVKNGLTAGWDDLDVNMHVNNAKYIAWILESVPRPFMESFEFASVTLEYKKECGMDSVLQSLTTVIRNSSEETEMQHSLRLETGPQVVRGKTTWRPKTVEKNINCFQPQCTSP